MHWLGWIVVALALLEGGWLAFDGSRALIVGDYVTPSSGSHAGQLGPWSIIVESLGIEPRSTLMKSVHAVLGTVWVAVIICFAFKLPWAWWGMFACAVLGLWYLPFGTFLSIVQIILLLTPAVRHTLS